MIKTINIKQYNPSCDVALANLELEIERCKLESIKVIKVLHGYGSNGVGGTIKKEMNKLLKNLVKNKKIYSFINGEHFSANHEEYNAITEQFPELILDEDLIYLNSGMTLIILSK